MKKIIFFSIWLFCFIVTAQTSPRDNAIINGGFQLFQRYPASAVTLNGSFQYAADRFAGSAVGSATVLNSKTSPGYSFTSSALLVSSTVGNSGTIAAADYLINNYQIEGYDFTKFKGKTMTLSFGVRATNPGTYCVSITNANQTRAYIMPYTINAANTYEKKSLTFKHDTTGGWNYDNNGAGMRITWTWLAGTDWTTATAANTWYTPTANEWMKIAACTGNLVPNSSDNAFLSEVDLHEGSQIQNFVYHGKDFTQELAAAQRYYYKTYDLTVGPGTAGAGSFNRWFSNGLVPSALALNATINFPVKMRTSPGTTVYSEATGAGNMAACPGGDMAASIVTNSSDSTVVEITDTTVSGDKRCAFELTSDAEF